MIHHDLVVTLDPANHRLKVRDRIRIPGAFVTAPFTISLNADLDVQAVSAGLKLIPMRSRVHAVLLPSEVGDFADEVRRVFL